MPTWVTVVHLGHEHLDAVVLLQLGDHLATLADDGTHGTVRQHDLELHVVICKQTQLTSHWQLACNCGTGRNVFYLYIIQRESELHYDCALTADGLLRKRHVTSQLLQQYICTYFRKPNRLAT